MFAWLIKKLAKPILPLLRQAHKVLRITEKSLENILEGLLDSGFPEDIEAVQKLRKALKATQSAKSAVEKAIKFFGGEVEALTDIDDKLLEEEVEKLEKLT